VLRTLPRRLLSLLQNLAYRPPQAPAGAAFLHSAICKICKIYTVNYYFAYYIAYICILNRIFLHISLHILHILHIAICKICRIYTVNYYFAYYFAYQAYLIAYFCIFLCIFCIFCILQYAKYDIFTEMITSFLQEMWETLPS
jgi:hypothetical protein